MNDIMIDLETLGDRSRSVITSIAAVAFDMETGKTGCEFFTQVDIQSCLFAGLNVTGGTIKWWMQQNDNAREHIHSGNSITLNTALNSLSGFITKFQDPVIWGNSAKFDLGILEDAYNALQMEKPWSPWNERCVRTLASLRPEIKRNEPFQGVKHNPLNDCKHQIRYCSKTWKALNHGYENEGSNLLRSDAAL